jgi:hypothetical protein
VRKNSDREALLKPYEHLRQNSRVPENQPCSAFVQLILTLLWVMVFAEDIRKVILKLADERGTENTFASDEVARAVDAKNWDILSEQVKLVAGILVQEGKIIAMHGKGPQRFRKV